MCVARCFTVQSRLWCLYSKLLLSSKGCPQPPLTLLLTIKWLISLRLREERFAGLIDLKVRLCRSEWPMFESSRSFLKTVSVMFISFSISFHFCF